jgi:hypothetical protein
MSNRAITWAYRQRTGSGTRKAVLVALADQANSDGVCWPGQRSLAEDLEFSERAIRKALGDLVVTGFIVVKHRRWEDSQKQRTNYYVLNLERAEPRAGGAGGTTFLTPAERGAGEPAERGAAEEPSALNPQPEPSSSSPLSTEPIGERSGSDDEDAFSIYKRVEAALDTDPDLTPADVAGAVSVIWPRLKAGERFTSPVSYALTCARNYQATRLAAEKSQEPKRLELGDGTAYIIQPDGSRDLEEATG